MGPRIFRALSLFVGVCGIAVYVFWLWTWWMVAKQGDFASRNLLQQILFVLDDAIFGSGLPPLLLTIYFLILKKSARANLRGLIYVAFFIPIHYYVAATTAHSTPEIYLPAQFIELIAAVALIAFWKKEGPQSTSTTP